MSAAPVMMLSSLTLILPGISIIWLLRSKAAQLLTSAVAASAVLFAFLSGTWGFYSYYLRFVIAALFIVVLYRYLSKANKYIRISGGRFGSASGYLALMLFLAREQGNGHIPERPFELCHLRRHDL